MVKVTKIASHFIHYENVDTGRTDVIWRDNFHRRYRAFESPPEGTATTGGEK